MKMSLSRTLLILTIALIENLTLVRTSVPNQCQCNIGSFDDGFNQVCQSCDNTCLSCSGPTSYDCLTCSIQNMNRKLYLNQCQCLTGFFDDGVNSACKKCENTCLSCSGPTSYDCLTCSIQDMKRKLYLYQCQCLTGFFDDGVNSACKKCDHTCLSCTGRTRFDCSSCQIKNMKRTLNQNQCKCFKGYYDDEINPVCQKCDQTCQTCKGLTIHDCLSCLVSLHRELYNLQCVCNLGYEEKSGKCQIISSTNVQISQPLCVTVNCNTCPKAGCQVCNQGFFLNGQQCCPCDKRCLQCSGPLNTQCITCRFIKINSRCKLCSEVLGLYVNSKGKCVGQCGGDGKNGHQKIDANNDQSLICVDKTIGKQYASLKFITNSSSQFKFNNTRQAILQFNQQEINNFQQWQFKIPNYNSKQYNLTHSFDSNSLRVTILFNQSINGKQLDIIATADSQIKNKHLFADIPDFTMVSQQIKQATQGVLTITRSLTNIIIIIMAVALISGGFDLIWELLDLLQLLSYLKYLNVDYPYNVDNFFDYLSTFNFCFITNNLPYMNNLQDYLVGNYGNSGAVKPSYKMEQDGYFSLFSYNFLGIIFGWVMAFFFYYFSKLLSRLLLRWVNLDHKNRYSGYKLTLYMLRFDLSSFLVPILNGFKSNFFFNGLLRTYITSDYALNFIIMMELKQFHFLSTDLLLASSSWLALIILFIKMIVSYIIVKLINNHHRTQFIQTNIQNKIGSMMDGLKLQTLGAKYFGIQDLIKKFLFMFSLVVFYESPLYQVAGITFTSSITSWLYYIIKPNEEQNDFLKTFSSEIQIFFSTCLIFMYAIDDEIKFLNESKKLNFGWIIICFCLSVLIVQIYIDVKLQMIFIICYLKKLKRTLIKYYNRQMRIKEFNKFKNSNQQDHQPLGQIDI